MDEQAESYFGIVELTGVQNWSLDGAASTIPDLTDHEIKIVHYPTCQQLLLWLPDNGWNYHNFTITKLDTEQTVLNCPVNHLLSGTIHLVLDTLFIPPGSYVLKIDHNNGLVHQINFKKYPEGEAPPVAKLPETVVEADDNSPIVYRDGFGNEMPNEDLLLREKVLDDLYNKFTRKVEYRSSGRSGEVIYHEGDRKITFYMEMGGGNCVFYLDVPGEKDWERRTGFRLDERDSIVEHVATMTGRDQASGCRYEIRDQEIVYYRK